MSAARSPSPPQRMVRSWGLPGPFEHHVIEPGRVGDAPLSTQDSWLPHGNGRSYGDVCLNTGHTLVHTRWLDRYVSFDAQQGVLECEPGVTLARIVGDMLPRGWFLPVVPGTRFVTVGGAIANDVHGKNHHSAGTFGHHVQALWLRRSDGRELECSPQLNADLFAATVGGMGLTGLITRARLALRRVPSGWMRVHSRRFRSLDEFFHLNHEAESRHEYTVSWIDCLSGGQGRLRGVLLAGDHADAPAGQAQFPQAPGARSFPLTPPVSLINPLSLRAFNAAYFHRAAESSTFDQPVWPYFWPLDALHHWNRIYGRRGLLQYQFVVPQQAGRQAIEEVLALIRASGMGSFLAVLKTFGDRPSPGMMSFARPGLTLALDFPNVPRVHGLFERLDEVMLRHGGAIYPAKDARCPAALFAQGYPRLAEFLHQRDPACGSTMARRMGIEC